MMYKKSIFFALLAGLLVLSMAGCKDSPDPGDNGNGNGGGGGGGGVPSELVAKWYLDFNGNGTLDTGEDAAVVYEFKSDGSLVAGGISAGFSYTVSGDKITLTTSGVTATTSITFKIEGKKLTLSGSTDSGFTPGVYLKK
jgi:hypothetical protein